MSTDKDLDKAKANKMDDVKIKESKIPNFTVQKKTDKSKSANPPTQEAGTKVNDIDNIVAMPKLRVLRGGGLRSGRCFRFGVCRAGKQIDCQSGGNNQNKKHNVGQLFTQNLLHLVDGIQI